MNLGQTLMAILALVLFATITVTINRTRITATTHTIDYQVELEAINYGQSIMETISNSAITENGFNSLTDSFERERTFIEGSGRTLYATVEVDDSPSLIRHDVSYKKVTVLVYSGPDRQENSLKTRYTATFNKWWELDNH